VPGHELHDFGDRGDLERCPDDNHQVDLVAVVIQEAVVKGFGKCLAKKGDIGLWTAYYQLGDGR
jgi:hypothetical protein